MGTRTIILTLVISTFLMADDGAKGDQQRMTGCLTKTKSGEYMLTDEAGKRVTVTGADLEKHSANHRVILHGTHKTENGRSVFRVDQIEHVADSCVTPTAD